MVLSAGSEILRCVFSDRFLHQTGIRDVIAAIPYNNKDTLHALVDFYILLCNDNLYLSYTEFGITAITAVSSQNLPVSLSETAGSPLQLHQLKAAAELFKAGTEERYFGVKVFQAVGVRKSGKTTTVENLVRLLKKDGLRVGTVKCINCPMFAIEEGRDSNTERHRRAGADVVVAFGRNETDFIYPGKQDLNDILETLSGDGLDYCIVEGGYEYDLPRIVCFRNPDEISDRITGKTFALSGVGTDGAGSGIPPGTLTSGFPALSALTHSRELLDLVLSRVPDLVLPVPGIPRPASCRSFCRGCAGHSGRTTVKKEVYLEMNGSLSSHGGEGFIRFVSVSEKRGIPKKPVPEAVLRPDWGIVDDAHAGNWHRQVSLLSQESITAFTKRGARVNPGDFGENLIVSGIDFKRLAPGIRIQAGEGILEITQIGKECHSHCAIFRQIGDCIMPREGVFARVVSGGIIKPGDRVSILEEAVSASETATDTESNVLPGGPASASAPAPFRAAVVTLSDRGFRGECRDESGPFIAEKLAAAGYDILETVLLPDDGERIRQELVRLADAAGADLIVTTGGTGFSERDVTPEATLAVATRNAPGIAEAIRAESLKITRRAMLSRAVSVIRNRTLIVNLPGSRKAVEECLNVIMSELRHGLGILLGRDGDCGRH